ncbi:hypothetical protein KY290_005022 [Solanum tuberosum]|uniref:Fe2OG dioxygenase domain-containing protein n=1 Tax=Solanum tuberosum TaxID=4113 RepID=A0ABQ7WDD0_SOLTU|nr:hypothetical protein KY289_006867 [Solanum tuberosum]KAH0778595.1 hypothetical protein KY290_005022 [Solanum tuberosum]
MANIISSKVEALPPTYVFPMHERLPALVPIIKEIPVIDLGEGRTVIAQQLVKALEQYGFFQVTNHGVPEDLMDEAMKVYEEFFNLPVEEKENYANEGETLYTSNPKHSNSKEHKYRKEVLEHNCNIDGQDKKHGLVTLQNIVKYEEVIGAYSSKIRELSMIIFDLVREGLDLEEDYFGKEHEQKMIVHHFPVCPDPSSTLGMDGHCDPNLITIYQQQVYGLQILKNEEWIGVEPLPHAFVVNFGLPIMVMTNGKMESVAHRLVPNTTQTCTGIGTYFYPANIVEPAKSFVGPDNPPLFKPFKWDTDFFPHYANKKSHNDDGKQHDGDRNSHNYSGVRHTNSVIRHNDGGIRHIDGGIRHNGGGVQHNDSEIQHIGAIDENKEESKPPTSLHKLTVSSLLISPFQQFHVQFPVLMSWISVDRNILTLHMAYIMDTNEEERVKGITVEVGRAPFEVETTRFTILDALVSSEHSLTKEIV